MRSIYEGNFDSDMSFSSSNFLLKAGSLSFLCLRGPFVLKDSRLFVHFVSVLTGLKHSFTKHMSDLKYLLPLLLILLGTCILCNSMCYLLQGINEMILSLKYDNYKAEIISADAQTSYKGGVSVLVTGVLVGEDGTQRMFTQSFFLAPQDTGYYVLNDMFRYVEGKSAAPVSLLTSEDIAEAPEALEAPVNPEPGKFIYSHCIKFSRSSFWTFLSYRWIGFAEVCDKPEEENVSVKEVSSNGEDATLYVENGEAPLPLKETIDESPADSSTIDASDSVAVAPPVVQGDGGSKRSYASIVSVMNLYVWIVQLRKKNVWII